MKKIITTSLIAALLPLSGLAATYNFSSNSSKFTDMPHGTAVTWGLNNDTSVADGTKVTTGSAWHGTNNNDSSLANYTKLLADINNSGMIVTGATLTLWDIYDWTGEATDPADALFVNILGGLDSGIKSKSFSSGTAPSSLWSLAVNPFIDSPSTSNDFNDKLQAPTALKFNEADAVKAGSLLKANSSVTKSNTPAGVTWSDPNGGFDKNPDFNLVLSFTSANLSLLTALLDTDTGTASPNIGLGFAAECHYYMDGVTLTVTTGRAPSSVPDSGSSIALMGLGFAALAAFRRLRK